MALMIMDFNNKANDRIIRTAIITIPYTGIDRAAAVVFIVRVDGTTSNRHRIGQSTGR